ncbi:hypothetical protein DEO72_LG2g2237 [Vigna unguiculata]|uniref:Uncharacterized protein n=1 Tax=Vigna unguiculata TaxID=3917 RepID=A0A4D6KUX4_VIGUN|nr:hypothetical protein DEO72_LG2g2237 [Vigna unguiculata]
MRRFGIGLAESGVPDLSHTALVRKHRFRAQLQSSFQQHSCFSVPVTLRANNGSKEISVSIFNFPGFLGVSSLTHSSWCVIPGDLVANIHHGVSSLTQPSTLAHTIHPRPGQLIETERLLEEVKQATMRADETDKKYALVQEELSLIKQQLAMMLEKQGGGSSTGTSRVHPHYDEDLDDHPVP